MSNMYLNVVSTFKGDGLTKATQQLGAFGKQAGGLGSVVGKLGATIAGLAVSAKAIEFGREAITSARDLERNLFGLDTVFGDLAPKMRDFTLAAEDLGLSQSKAAKAATFIGSVLKQSGFAMSDVAVETEKLVGLATDLSALYGYDVQEALLGMTALFRGEYDPIEKFGVAMKQNEINSELAARGQEKLQGAARRNAEQIIRLDLLYQRSSDALGTFTKLNGSLYTEQKKLGATFENFQATLGNAVLPAVADLNTAFRELLQNITPTVEQGFTFLAEVLTGVIGLFKDAINPSTELGESFSALGIQFESLLKTIFGKDVSLADVFKFASAALGMFIDLMHDLLNIVENTVIGFKVLGKQVGLYFESLFSLDPSKLLSFDAAGEIKGLIAAKDAAKALALELDIARKAAVNLDNTTFKNHVTSIYNTAEAWQKAEAALLNYSLQAGGNRSMIGQYFADLQKRMASVKPVFNTGGTSGFTPTEGVSGAAKDAKNDPTGLTAWLLQAQEDAEIAQRRIALIGRGLSEAVVDALLSTKDPLTTANEALALVGQFGQAALRQLTDAFNKSAAGQALIAKQIEDRNKELAQKQEEARQREKEVLEKRQKAFESFADSVKGLFGQIKDSILASFELPSLGNSVNSITRNIRKLLERTRSFANSITQLSGLGLDPALLQQVIQAGPMAGARLAASLVGGGAGFIGQVNQAFSEFGGLASGIAGVGTQSAFGTPQTVNNYSIEVTGGLATGADVGRAVVNAIKDYERQSGAAWRG
jgi:hypothetical protein